MPATVARIGFIQNEFRKVISSSATADTRYGALARQSDDPIETFFDSTTDAQAIADERKTLMSAERRLFQVTVNDAAPVLALSYIGAVPLGRYRDTERVADRAVLVGDLTVDLARNTANLTVWG